MKTISLKNYLQFAIVLILLTLTVNCSSDSDSGGSQDTPTPIITVVGNFTSFGSLNEGSDSASQSVEVTASDLTSNLIIKATDNFEVSLDDVTFTNQVAISSINANSGTNLVYVRFSPAFTIVGVLSGMVSFVSDQAVVRSLNLSGESLSIAPIISVTGEIVDFGDVTIMQNSDSQSIVLNGDNLVTDIEVSANGNFKVSLDDTTFSDSVQIPTSSANDDVTVYVIFSPTEVGSELSVLSITNADADNVTISLEGNGIPVMHNYSTFNQKQLLFGANGSQSASQNFMMHNDLSNIENIKMYVQLDCPTEGCNAWDVFAHIQVKDTDSNEWYEIGRYITPYGVDNSQLDRGFEIDVTDFKSLLQGNVELRAYIEVWGSDGWNLSVDFDYEEGIPDYPYYAISRVVQYNQNSLEGVPYGVDASAFDLIKSVQIPVNAQSTHLRTIITGWGHATPADAGRGCAEWCYREHDVKIDGGIMFQHDLEPLGCSSNSVNPQNGNWEDDRAGWCPGMAVPVRVDAFGSPMAGNSFTFEYDFEDWTADGGTTSGDPGAYYAISTFVVVKSNSMINKPTVTE